MSVSDLRRIETVSRPIGGVLSKPAETGPVWPSIYAVYLEVAACAAGRAARSSYLTLLQMGFT